MSHCLAWLGLDHQPADAKVELWIDGCFSQMLPFCFENIRIHDEIALGYEAHQNVKLLDPQRLPISYAEAGETPRIP